MGDFKVVECDLEATALRCRAHGAGQHPVAGRQVRQRCQLHVAVVDAVADLDSVAAASEQQDQLAHACGQVGHCLGRVHERLLI